MSRAPSVRPPAVAGRFYDADEVVCAADARKLCAAPSMELPTQLLGGIVPHAGWVCSGRIAGAVFHVLSQRSEAQTILLCGSVHTMHLDRPTLDSAEAWQSPLGTVQVDAALRRAVSDLADFQTLDAAHAAEHSLEVQLPLMQTCFGFGVRVVPCLVPPVPASVGWGAALGQLLAGWSEPVLVVASSDLTHYGPNYRFTPEGVGEAGVRWADQNDRRLIEMVEQMQASKVVAETQRQRNACGGGAIAATVAACGAMGARRGWLLEQTNSFDELRKIGHADSSNSVGYAGMVLA